MTTNTRIAWLSPFGPRSDIGAYTRCLLPHFAKPDGGAFDCDLFINANGNRYDSPVPAMDIPAAGHMGEILSRYDAAFFNLGNNFQNHGDIVNALRGVPGIAILHDFSYHHFFAHRCFTELRTPAAYARLVHNYYGSTGFNMALRSGVITRDATFYAPWDGENVSDYPLMQPIVTLAAAAVVHSQFMEEQVAKVFKGPILRLFLPSDQKQAPSSDDAMQWRAKTATSERCQFVSFGHINRSKCLDTVILAIAQSPALRARAQLIIAGKPDDKEYVREIESMVNRLGLIKQVTFEYSVTNDRLLEIKRETDVFLNLRYPNTEGASGSLIEMMSAGRPVIAYRAGSYADMPEETVHFIDRGNGLELLVEAMESLMAQPERRVEIGRAARAHLDGQDSQGYVRRLKKFVADIRGDLRRRARFVAPVRDGLFWARSDVISEDADWFSDLTNARQSLLLLDRDPGTHSPEMFLNWPMDDLVAFSSRVLLHAPSQPGLPALLAEYAQRLGRWSFYRLISKVRLYQTHCERPEISKPDLELLSERVPDVAFWDVASRLQPDIFLQILYLAALERGSAVAERDFWVARIRNGMHPASILIDFLESAEYRQTFSDDLMSEVEVWARDQATVSRTRREQLRARVVWPAGTEIRFSEDNPRTDALLGSNWHRRDAQGRWSDGRIGDLRFILPEDSAKHGATLTLKLRVAGTEFTGERRIVAHHNRKEIASLIVQSDAPVSWNVALPASIAAKEGVNLQLTVDRDFSPSANGQSTDRRSLGIMLIEGRLTIDAPDASAPSKR